MKNTDRVQQENSCMSKYYKAYTDLSTYTVIYT